MAAFGILLFIGWLGGSIGLLYTWIRGIDVIPWYPMAVLFVTSFLSTWEMVRVKQGLTEPAGCVSNGVFSVGLIGGIANLYANDCLSGWSATWRWIVPIIVGIVVVNIINPQADAPMIYD